MSDAGVAVVTGAAGAIGAAVLDRLRADGWDGVGADLRGTDADVDITDADSVSAFVAGVERDRGAIDVLVNAAGVLRSGDVLERDLGDLEELLRVNAVGTARVTRTVAARMRTRGRGSIITVSSNAAGIPRAGMAAYASSKAAVTAYAKSFGLELAPSGIRVNVVSPGTTRSPMLQSTGASIDDAIRTAIAGEPDRFKPGIPLGRVADPHDIAHAVAFLASDAAQHITLQELLVDGGATLR